MISPMMVQEAAVGAKVAFKVRPMHGWLSLGVCSGKLLNKFLARLVES
jgi:hypothetical protein